MNQDIIEQINESPYKAFFAIAGGGQTFIGDYCKIHGASKTFIGAIVPYNQTIFDAFVKSKVESYASSDAARKLAVASYHECIKAGVPKEHALGIGAANSIVKTEERIGRVHKFYIALHGYNVTKVTEMRLNQGRTREEEESLACYLIYRLLANHVLKTAFPAPPNEGFNEEVENATQHYIDLVENKTTITTQILEGDTFGIYAGSWNPLHDGHLQVKTLAEKILGKPVVMELSVNNTHKPQLDFIEIQKRINNLGPLNYVLTGAARFIDKVRILKQSWGEDKKFIFIVGADTWNRIWDEKHFELEEKTETFFIENGVKFLVFGREGIVIRDIKRNIRIPSQEAANLNLSFSSSAIRENNASN